MLKMWILGVVSSFEYSAVVLSSGLCVFQLMWRWLFAVICWHFSPACWCHLCCAFLGIQTCETTLRCVLFCLIYFDCLRSIVPCPVTAVRSVWQLWILLLVNVVPVGLKTLKFSVSLEEALRLGLLPQTCGDLVFRITFCVEPLWLACCMQLINLPNGLRQHGTCMNGYWRPDPSVYSLCQLVCLHSVDLWVALLQLSHVAFLPAAVFLYLVSVFPVVQGASELNPVCNWGKAGQKWLFMLLKILLTFLTLCCE